MARLCRAGCEAVGLEGVSPALRAWASNFSLRGQSKVTNRAATPAYSPDLRRVPSAHPLVRRHAPTGHPCPGAARSTSCLAAWTSVLASANKRGNSCWPYVFGQLSLFWSLLASHRYAMVKNSGAAFNYLILDSNMCRYIRENKCNDGVFIPEKKESGFDMFCAVIELPIPCKL